MALELESKIMSEIGLGNHFNWYNGSSCRYTRQTAADRVESIIQKHHDAGEPIAEPDKHLIATLKKVAAFGDVSEYSLTKTWQAASYVIAEHIHQATATEQDRTNFYEKLQKFIENKFLPEEEQSFGIDGVRMDIRNFEDN